MSSTVSTTLQALDSAQAPFEGRPDAGLDHIGAAFAVCSYVEPIGFTGRILLIRRLSSDSDGSCFEEW
jgi:hypothetical protein